MASTISAGTSAGTALNLTSDTTGNLAFTTGSSNLTAMTLDTNQNVTFANNVTYSGTITATAFSGNGVALTAINASNVTSGTLATARLPTTGVNASTITTGTLATAQLPTVPVASGGTGLTTLTANNVLIGNGTGNVAFVAPGSNGNILTSNGTAWTSSTPAAGGVTSVATGNGLSGGTITSTGTLVVACPTFNSVGSYCWAGFVSGVPTAGSNYSTGTGTNQVTSWYWQGGIASMGGSVNNLSGTWKWMGAGAGGGNDQYIAVLCRVS